jgi:hypothetical protein
MKQENLFDEKKKTQGKLLIPIEKQAIFSSLWRHRQVAHSSSYTRKLLIPMETHANKSSLSRHMLIIHPN